MADRSQQLLASRDVKTLKKRERLRGVRKKNKVRRNDMKKMRVTIRSATDGEEQCEGMRVANDNERGGRNLVLTIIFLSFYPYNYIN